MAGGTHDRQSKASNTEQVDSVATVCVGGAVMFGTTPKNKRTSGVDMHGSLLKSADSGRRKALRRMYVCVDMRPCGIGLISGAGGMPVLSCMASSYAITHCCLQPACVVQLDGKRARLSYLSDHHKLLPYPVHVHAGRADAAQCVWWRYGTMVRNTCCQQASARKG